MGKQLHADVYRALRCVEENETDSVPPERLLKIANLAGELVAALDDLWGRSDGGPELGSDRASEARTARSAGHWRVE
jgi:hypothetical protein